MPSTPTIGTSGNSYATIATADTYMDDSIRGAANWTALTTDAKSRALLSATRLMDKQCWIGEKTAAANTLDWPRTGVTDASGAAVDEDTVPNGIIYGTIELAYELSQDPTLESGSNTGSNDKRYKAGSVELELFRPGGVLGVAGITRFPTVVMEYIKEFLCGSTRGTPVSYGTDHCSQFDSCDTLDTEPFA
jgi:hypothetical protein